MSALAAFVLRLASGSVWALGEPGNLGPPKGFTWYDLNKIRGDIARSADAYDGSAR